MKTLTKHLTAKTKNGNTLVIPYIMAGDHKNGLDGLSETVELLQDAAASAIEIGIPFSDPVADGPIIQEAGIRALKKQTSIFQIVKKLQTIDAKVPLVIMSYFNPIYNYGIEKFIADLQKTSVKGLIIPDMPFEHNDYIEPVLQDADISLVRLVSLTTPKERQKTLVKNAQGFIYAVAVNGTTGVGKKYAENIYEHLAYLKSESEIPVLAGFGVSNIDQVKNFAKVCDGVIIGSFIVNALHSGENQKAADLVKSAVNIQK
ncbi:MAG: tryptophan synthase subunit alpha [Chitinispirillales bacterium]|jgi:tryptophan synthase alpha chain|nr:tryptophan synthase subunit alpha [Chitinispirillales bacterium]